MVSKNDAHMNEGRWISVRMVLGTLLLGGAWYLVGWLAMSEALGFALAAWSLVLGPLLLPYIIWFFERGMGRVRPVNLTRHPGLASTYFRQILKRPGPVPLVWSFGSRDLGIFWFENVFTRRQRVVVTTGWLALDTLSQQKDFEILWEQIARMSRWQRLRRTFQISLWMGPISLLDMLFTGLRWVLNFVGFDEMPDPAFWFMRILWSLRERWFGLERDNGVFLVSKRQEGKFVRLPKVWQSAMWGVWVQGPLFELHPAWRIWVHQSAFLERRT